MSGSGKPMQPFKCLALPSSVLSGRFPKGLWTCLLPPPNTALDSPVGSSVVALADVSEEEAFDAPFTAPKSEAALGTRRRKSAPGSDGVTNQALKNLPDVAITWMLAWLNTIWATCDIPASWKTAWVLPILKTGKPSSALGSYRPVTLLSCVAKLFERLVHFRLRWFLEASGLLSLKQTGFRSHLAAQDSVLYLTSAIEHNRAIGNYTLASFVDVQKAYDRVRASIAVGSLCAIGLRCHIMRCLAAYPGERTFAVKLGVTVSSTVPLSIGLPQGTVLSPTLFNVVMSRVVPSIQRDPLMSATIYADDVCVWVSGDDVKPLQKSLQSALDRLSDGLSDVGLAIAANKSRFIPLPGVRRRTKPVTLFATGNHIKRVREHRFLRVVIDGRFNGVAYVRAIQTVSRDPVNAIKRLCGIRSGSSPPGQ